MGGVRSPPFLRPSMPRLLIAFILLAPGLAAQTNPDGFDRLEDEVRATVLEAEIYQRQLSVAYDLALAEGRYARADSVAVLARELLEEWPQLPFGASAWPSAADALALRFLRGDLAALDWIADGGRWWQGFASEGRGGAVYTERPILYVRVRESTKVALARDSARVLSDLMEEGATEEQEAAARLALAFLTSDTDWSARGGVDPNDQTALNEGVDRFLLWYPESAYARFLRETVRHRYRPGGALVLYLDVGGAAPEATLGEATAFPFGFNVGFGLRGGLWNVELASHSAVLELDETLVNANGEEIVEGETLGIHLVGLSGGPRLALGDVDVLPYVSAGVLAQDITADGGENAPVFSTYEPPTRVGWGYGLALEYVVARGRPTWGQRLGLRAGVNRLHPHLNRGFEDLLGGSVTTFTVGIAAAFVVHDRVP